MWRQFVTARIRERSKRLGGYAFWLTSAVAIPLALDRLVVLPVLYRFLGGSLFGGFVWVLAVLNLGIAITSNGASLAILRQYGSIAKESRSIFLRTALSMTTGLAFIGLLLASFGSYFISPEAVKSEPVAIYLPLVAMGVLRASAAVSVAAMRVDRRFRSFFFIKCAEAVCLLGIIGVAPSRSVLLCGLVYLGSTAVPFALGVWFVKELRNGVGWWRSSDARSIRAVMVPGIAFTCVDASQIYIPRIFLGSLTSSGHEVAVLYAGTSIGNLFLIPVTLMGGLLLSMLAQHQHNPFTGLRAPMFVGGVLLCASVVGASSFVLGRWMISLLYPGLAQETLGFYHWVAIANGLSSVMLLLRPIAIRYGRLWIATLVSSVSLATQLLLLVFLVPEGQSAGAALALAGGAAVNAAVWVGYYFSLCKRPIVLSAKQDQREGQESC